MNKETYNVFKKIHLYNDIDEPELKRIRTTASPAIAEKIDIILHQVNVHNDLLKFDVDRFREGRFREESSRKRKDEVVVNFILFIADFIHNNKFFRSLVNPGAWESDIHLMESFKWLIYSIFTLLYNVEWKSEYFLYLDQLVSNLLMSDAKALREFALKIGIEFSEEPAEEMFVKFLYHSQQTFGPYYWRLIHWMAEAFSFRGNSPDIDLAKILWKNFTTELLYRTLRCGICMHHYKRIVMDEKFKNRLENDLDWPLLWYEIHNEVNSTASKTTYSKIDFEKDRKFIQSALY